MQTKEEISAFAKEVQERYGLTQVFYETLAYESWGWQNIQSTLKNPNGPNGREDSWGVCQIHLPSHPDITKEEAMNPRWCIQWTAEQFKAGHAWQWSGFAIVKQRPR